MTTEPRITFVYPPYGLYVSSPYMAPALLAAHLRRCGISSDSYDLNIRFFTWLAQSSGRLERAAIDVVEQYQQLQQETALPASRVHELYLLTRALSSLPAKVIAQHFPGDHIPPDADISTITLAEYAQVFVDIYAPHFCVDATTFSFERMLTIATGRRLADPFSLYLKSPEGSLVLGDICNASAVGLNVTYAEQFLCALLLARAAKETRDVLVVLGGPLISLLTPSQRSTLAGLPFVDACVVYEGEIPMHEMALAIRRGDTFERVPNLVYKSSSGEIRTNPVAAPLPPDELPAPEYNDDELPLYCGEINEDPPIRKRLSVFVARGCYWGKCSFCVFPNTVGYQKQKYEFRSPEKVLQDVVTLIQRHQVYKFHLATESLPPKWAERFCQLVLANGVQAQFFSFIRNESRKVWTHHLLRLMREAGFVLLSFGTESVTQRILDLMRKGSTVQDVFDNMYACHIAGIPTVNHLIVNYPTVAASEVLENIQFMYQNRDVDTFYSPQLFWIKHNSEVMRSPHDFGIELPDTSADGFRFYEFKRLTGDSTERLRGPVDALMLTRKNLARYSLTRANREIVEADTFNWSSASFSFPTEFFAIPSRFSLQHGGAPRPVVFFLARKRGKGGNVRKTYEFDAILVETMSLAKTAAGAPVAFKDFLRCYASDIRRSAMETPQDQIETDCIAILKHMVYTGFVKHVFNDAAPDPVDASPATGKGRLGNRFHVVPRTPFRVPGLPT
jgi:radical SAM superfamily enzyme YgiQ (UPF0313 family)